VPSRVIRDCILESESLSQVSLEAELVFRNLILIADDWGRLDGRTRILRLRMFPMREQVTDRDMAEWVEELELQGCVQPYTVEGKSYYYLPAWERYASKQKRARPRYPEPPGSSEILPEKKGKPKKPSGKIREVPHRVPPTPTPTPTPTPLPLTTTSSSASEGPDPPVGSDPPAQDVTEGGARDDAHQLSDVEALELWVRVRAKPHTPDVVHKEARREAQKAMALLRADLDEGRLNGELQARYEAALHDLEQPVPMKETASE
jgi:hypothetical protein